MPRYKVKLPFVATIEVFTEAENSEDAVANALDELEYCVFIATDIRHCDELDHWEKTFVFGNVEEVEPIADDGEPQVEPCIDQLKDEVHNTDLISKNAALDSLKRMILLMTRALMFVTETIQENASSEYDFDIRSQAGAFFVQMRDLSDRLLLELSGDE